MLDIPDVPIGSSVNVRCEASVAGKLVVGFLFEKHHVFTGHGVEHGGDPGAAQEV